MTLWSSAGQLTHPNGATAGLEGVNKFGRSTNVDSAVLTDVWDRANATDTQPLWVPPTEARIHNLKSTSTDDANAGTGAHTVRIWGLTSWITKEVTEVVTMNGTTDVATTNAYVIIHIMEIEGRGSAGPNVGDISATAVTDATVTSQITATKGRTQSSIYGFPSQQSAHMSNFYGHINKSGGAAGAVDVSLWCNPTPDTNPDTWNIQHTIGLITTGSSAHVHKFDPYREFHGPCIFKVQAVSTANDMDVDAGFGLVLIDE